MNLYKRDKYVVAVVNWLLKFASPDYRNFVSGAIRYGMNAAAQDERTGRPAPKNWEDWK